jgi:hypothetical protein
MTTVEVGGNIVGTRYFVVGSAVRALGQSAHELAGRDAVLALRYARATVRCKHAMSSKLCVRSRSRDATVLWKAIDMT